MLAGSTLPVNDEMTQHYPCRLFLGAWLQLAQRIKKKCKWCSREFYVKPFRAKTQKCCSEFCAASLKHKNSSTEYTCANCQIKFVASKNRVRRSKSGLVFCERKCKDAAQRIGGIVAIQPSHYGTHWNYRQAAFDAYKPECSRCGYAKFSEILVVHHKDRNRENNSVSNLEILCPTCHYEEHFTNQDGLWKNKRALSVRGST